MDTLIIDFGAIAQSKMSVKFASTAEIPQILGDNAMLFAKLVNNQKLAIVDQFQLECGTSLLQVPVAYKTWGNLNSTGTNAMIICHALSGSADVEDWYYFINKRWGPLLGKAFDYSKFFIVCLNVLGSPYGTASPLTLNPSTKQPYGPEFPLTTVRDDVNLHKLVLDALGVTRAEFVIGGSMGGMQALEWAFFPNYAQNIVAVATSARHSAWCISWGETQRASIFSDLKYVNGYYSVDNQPIHGLSAARMCALLTYRSQHSFQSRFDRKTMPLVDPKDKIESMNPLVVYHNEGHVTRLHPTKSAKSTTESSLNSVYTAQSYLRYQADKFINRFDANCYIAITRKLDTHDISRDRSDLIGSIQMITQPILVIGIETDGLFTVSEQNEIAMNAPNSEFHVIDSFEGHDGFLLEFEKMNQLISDFINKHSSIKSTVSRNIDPLDIKTSLFGEADDLMMW